MIRIKMRSPRTILSYLLILALNLTTFFLPVSATPIPEPYINELYANGVYYYNPCSDYVSGSGSGSNSNNNYIGHLDPSLILSAKNADKQYSDFRQANGKLAGDWSDTDTASMKTLLEAYGDLAYQVGRTVNIPYVAILVQLRYEDARSEPSSICGKNNLWGIACPPGTPPGGGKNYNTLGEGFVGYANAITNGYHNQAIGITDPKEFLEKLGPTWVQGDINGAGYALIGAMKNSVDALQNYINSPEGQAIVQTFTGYSGSSGSSGSDTSGTSGSSNSNTTDLIDSDGWFKDNSISGLQKESALDSAWKSRLRETPSSTYNNGLGKPTAILLHYTAGGPQDGTSGLKLYGDNLYPAHFTIDLVKKKAWQHFPLNQPSLATKYADQYSIQFEIIGYGYNARPGDEYDLASFGDEEWDYLAQYLIPISAYTGIPLTSDVPWEDPNWEVSNFTQHDLNLSGVIGHMHVQDDKIDPGNIWPQVQAAIQRGGGGSSGGSVNDSNVCGTSGNTITGSPGSIDALQQTVLKYAWPDGSHGTTPMPAYAELVSERQKAGLYVGGISYPGIDCGGWVTALMQTSGWDPNYNSGNGPTGTQEAYLRDPANGWEQIHPTDASELQPGDVAMSDDHTWAFVGDIPGFATQVASASLDSRAPCAGTESLNYQGARWYRKVK